MSLWGGLGDFSECKGSPGPGGGRPPPWVLSRPEDTWSEGRVHSRSHGGIVYLKYRLDYLFLFAFYPC